ncbi:hypothetical protein F4604DRAFT_1927622 [Suillus subluteus]|nr:hypothetical protein F4604DRAFT_1927622 [Suillus subluteus]
MPVHSVPPSPIPAAPLTQQALRPKCLLKSLSASAGSSHHPIPLPAPLTPHSIRDTFSNRRLHLKVAHTTLHHCCRQFWHQTARHNPPILKQHLASNTAGTPSETPSQTPSASAGGSHHPTPLPSPILAPDSTTQSPNSEMAPVCSVPPSPFLPHRSSPTIPPSASNTTGTPSKMPSQTAIASHNMSAGMVGMGMGGSSSNRSFPAPYLQMRLLRSISS